MDTPIGKSDQNSPGRRLALAACGVVLVGADLWLAAKRPERLFQAAGYAVFAALVLAAVYGWRRTALGAVVRPIQGWGYWVRLVLVVGGIVVAWTVAVCVAGAAAGLLPEMRRLEAQHVQPPLLIMCVYSPLVEELVYRWVFCLAFVPLLKPRATIVLGGVLFAALHLVYGSPAVDNAVAGFILVWAYLKSGSFLVPVGLHAAGNAFVFVLHPVFRYVVQ